MRSLRFDAPTFIAEYNQAHSAGLTLRDLADLMGVTYSTLTCRKHALAKRGIRLPKLKNGNVKRIAAKPMLRLAAPVQVQVEPVPMTFTIDVGAGHA
jgi:DNA-binding Xre family transcriptional regulator